MVPPSKVLITGIDGFTGRHLANHLSQLGWAVFGLTAPGAEDSPTKLVADLHEGDRIRSWLAEIRPNYIVHLAALSHVVGPPLPFYEVNVLGTESLLTAVEGAAIDPVKVVLASSANIYGQGSGGPISEIETPRPANHYAVSKLAMEAMARQWLDRLPILITRPFNYTGPGQSEAFLFAKLVGAFHRREPTLRLGNTNIARDLSDVSFVVQAYHKLLDSDHVGEVFNLCSGRSLSIAQALQILRNLTGHDPEIVVDDSLVRANDIDVLTGDPTRLQSAVGPLETKSPQEIFAGMLAALEASVGE